MMLDIATIVQTSVGLLIFAGIIGIFKFVSDIRRDLRQMNGRIVKVETWASEHTKLDDTRYESVLQYIHSLHQEIVNRLKEE